MKLDVLDRRDIETVVYSFYEKVKADDTIGFYFTEVIPVNWDKHLPLMCDFWENALFYSGKYEGNPMETHKRINQLYATDAQSFQKWMAIFEVTVDEYFEGVNANKLKKQAHTIASIMIQKIG